MDSASGAVRVYSGCLSTKASETVIEPKQEIEPSISEKTEKQSYRQGKYI